MAALRPPKYDPGYIRQNKTIGSNFSPGFFSGNAVSHFFHVTYEEGPFFIAAKCNFDYIQAKQGDGKRGSSHKAHTM
jgi:hypothetical protein